MYFNPNMWLLMILLSDPECHIMLAYLTTTCINLTTTCINHWVPNGLSRCHTKRTRCHTKRRVLLVWHRLFRFCFFVFFFFCCCCFCFVFWKKKFFFCYFFVLFYFILFLFLWNVGVIPKNIWQRLRPVRTFLCDAAPLTMTCINHWSFNQCRLYHYESDIKIL